jgi:hypothetical protein
MHFVQDLRASPRREARRFSSERKLIMSSNDSRYSRISERMLFRYSLSSPGL